MARALAGGMVEQNSAFKLIAYDPSPESLREFQTVIDTQIARRDVLEAVPQSDVSATDSLLQIADSNQQVVQAADIVFLAVKPQVFAAAMKDIDFHHGRTESPLLVSVMAGVSIAKIREQTQSERIIRVMPNTPCLIGIGVLGMAPASFITQGELDQVKELLQPMGLVIPFEERLIDAVTGLSGSGPAYVYSFIEALTQGGVAEGIPVQIARQMALQTVIGSAKLLETSQIHPVILREQVTSPGGTTIAGLAALEEHHFSHAVMNAVKAATDRSRDLGG